MKRQQLEKLWREEKYRVMFHSQKHYNQIRQAMHDQLAHDQIEPLISSALQQKPTAGSLRNACQHEGTEKVQCSNFTVEILIFVRLSTAFFIYNNSIKCM